MAGRRSSGCFNIMKLFRRKGNKSRHHSNNEVEQQLWAEIQELKEKLAEKERCLEETARDMAILRNQFHLPEGLRPTPGAKQTTKTTVNQFNKDVMVPTPEVVEPPAQFEYARGYGQMGPEQPTSQILPMEQIMSDENDTWPAATFVPKSQTENHFNEDVMGLTSEVVETPVQFEYSGGYGQMEYEQPMFQFQMTNPVFTYYYDGWPVGTWVPTLHRDNPFCGDSVGQMPPGYLQYSPQLEWMNPYQWS